MQYEAVHLAVMEFIRSIRREIRDGPWSIEHSLSVSALPSFECFYSQSAHRSHVIHHVVRESIRFMCMRNRVEFIRSEKNRKFD